MNIDGKTIWQIAAGNGKDTHYAKKCLEEGAIFIGPGNQGAWPDCEVPLRQHGRHARQIGIVKRFAEELKPGDLIVLRVGTQQVYGVGEIVGSYDWSERYKNVQGWDLQHFRQVRWLWHQDGKPKEFPVHSLKFGNRVQRLISPEVHHWLHSLDVE